MGRARVANTTPDRLRGSDRLADTGAMQPKPEPPQPTSWNVYKVAQKAIWLGTVEAPDKRTAIEKAAVEFKVDAWRLYAVERR
jgi:hypothetical protein